MKSTISKVMSVPETRGAWHSSKNDPFSELPSGHFFRWLSLNRWRAIVDQNQSGNTLVFAKSGWIIWHAR